MAELDVLYEDNHVICAVKPQGVLSQRSEQDPPEPDMLSLIGEYIRVKYQKPGRAFVGLVHRLDRNVGGTMLFAKTSKGAARLSAEMREGRFRKGYFALAEGHFKNKRGVLVNMLHKDEKRNIVTEDEKRGRKSVLIYDTAGVIGDYTLVFAIPVTGRTHQIRAQLSFAGHPLADDVKYGGRRVTSGKISYPALWSSVICVKHPVKDEYLMFKSTPKMTPPWDITGDDSVIKLCADYLKGFHENGFDSLYGIWN